MLSFTDKFKQSVQDIAHGIGYWRIWWLLGYLDIQVKYRRSTLGAFWITASMAIMAYTIGYLYGNLFKLDPKTYLPYLTAGIITWHLISTFLTEATNAFIESASSIKQHNKPLTIYMLRIVIRNLIIFLHNILVFVPIIIYFHIDFTFWSIIYLILGVFILLCCLFSIGMFLAILGARFRDIQPIINSFISVAFFITPIVWMPSLLPPERAWLATINPLTYLIALIREPLTGAHLSSDTLIYCIIIFLIMGILTTLTLAKSKTRVAYWI